MQRTSHGQTTTRRSVLAALGLLGAGAVPALAGCGSERSAAPPILSGPSGPVPTSTVVRVDVPLAAASRVPELADGMRAMATRLHAAAATSTENLTLSPLSIAVAFGMLRAGARGEAARRLDEAFGFPAGGRAEGSPHEGFNALTAALLTPPQITGRGTAPVVEVANALFVSPAFGPAVQRPFVDLLARHYGAQAEAVDFTSPSAKQTMDAWASEHTHGRIERLLDVVDPTLLMVLANAVYLKAGWWRPFDPEDTTTQEFATASGPTVRAQLMTSPLYVPYSENGQWQRATLPYAGGELTMRVVLPRSTMRGTPALTSLLDVATAPVTADRRTLVEVVLPRWDTSTDLDLLKALGLNGLSDLSGIAPGAEVSAAIHRATITVDETGSEAAAVTAISVATSMPPSPDIVLRVDRPFVWAIVHEPSQTPVFLGHVVDPTS
jgi:serpin B